MHSEMDTIIFEAYLGTISLNGAANCLRNEKENYIIVHDVRAAHHVRVVYGVCVVHSVDVLCNENEQLPPNT